MAGIGFELRKILKKDSYWSLLKAYAYAGVISSGPWILSIIGILVIGVMSLSVVAPESLIIQFQLSVTYLIAFSLILTGCLQTSFTRYVADRLYERKDELVLSNFHGVLCLVTIACGLSATGVIAWFFPEQSVLYKVLMVGSFVVLGNIWIATIFLSSMKEYKAVLLLYGLGYGLTIGAALAMRSFGLEGLLFGFFIGQFFILVGMLGLTVRNYSSDTLLAWDFLKKGRMYVSLIWLGLVYNLAIWIDKFLFWFYPETSQLIIGPIRNSPIYDLPIFLAYLSILPGMASFLVRMETDFVERYQEFYDAIRGGASLDHIQHAKNEMVRTIRLGLFEIMKIQFVVSLLIWAIGPPILRWLEISELYESLLYVDIVAAGLQVLFLGILNVMFYLDKRLIALGLSSLFLILNVILTTWSLYMGLPYYGYGFAVSLLVVVILGMHFLDKKLQKLEYETFMLQ
ncbi:MAG: pellicle/biofilm biosynthesis Wzx-like polysaccharide transporter PelG [Nitrospirales bacterium]|nr:MAG: pellicle/biofilm biosynthesis Wzx-like polysaccharide transporter PelG [Nitrospirales bacterium]